MIQRARKDGDGLFTLKHRPFIVRTDISAAFTADTALYMEMLHRDFKVAYSKMGLPPGSAKTWIEVLVYADRKTYLANGGGEGSGGQFMQWIFDDRPPGWPALNYRLMMFTDGETKFKDWEKGTLKHEAAHMELQLRLGLFVDCPRWWNEGQASCFEDWDFDLSVDENLALIPRRGRYAPVTRRLHGTDRFKPFSYVWEIDAESWHKDMTSTQGLLNYVQAWSLAAFMLNEGRDGRKAFQTIYNLSKRVGADRDVSTTGAKTRAWEVQFPRRDQEEMEKQWLAWIEKNLPKDGVNPDEWEGLIDLGFDPRHDTLVELTKETYAEVAEELKKRIGDKDDSAAPADSGSRKSKKKSKK
jgi:hypothetical protein